MTPLRFARGTDASLLLVQGAHPRVVKEILGGRSQICLILNTYRHVSAQMQLDATRCD